jgi:hypothetical protein
MKIIGTFGLAMIASIALLQPAQGGSRGGGHSSSSGPHFSGSAGHFAGGHRSFSGGGARFHTSPAHFSSQGAFRNRAAFGPRQFAVNRTTALNPRVYSRSTSRFAGNRASALNSRGVNARASNSVGLNNARIVARRSGNWHRDWDRGRDHFWHGHRCRWFNNAWVIFDPFFPYSYGYGYDYPYGAYPYYDGAYYDDGYAANEYSQEPVQSQYDNGSSDSSVSQVQSALARQGYYRGAIDGNMGPATRNALRQYQRRHGLDATGQIDRPVIEALGLG